MSSVIFGESISTYFIDNLDSMFYTFGFYDSNCGNFKDMFVVISILNLNMKSLNVELYVFHIIISIHFC